MQQQRPCRQIQAVGPRISGRQPSGPSERTSGQADANQQNSDVQFERLAERPSNYYRNENSEKTETVGRAPANDH